MDGCGWRRLTKPWICHGALLSMFDRVIEGAKEEDEVKAKKQKKNTIDDGL